MGDAGAVQAGTAKAARLLNVTSTFDLTLTRLQIITSLRGNGIPLACSWSCRRWQRSTGQATGPNAGAGGGGRRAPGSTPWGSERDCCFILCGGGGENYGTEPLQSEAQQGLRRGYSASVSSTRRPGP